MVKTLGSFAEDVVSSIGVSIPEAHEFIGRATNAGYAGISESGWGWTQEAYAAYFIDNSLNVGAMYKDVMYPLPETKNELLCLIQHASYAVYGGVLHNLEVEAREFWALPDEERTLRKASEICLKKRGPTVCLLAAAAFLPENADTFLFLWFGAEERKMARHMEEVAAGRGGSFSAALRKVDSLLAAAGGADRIVPTLKIKNTDVYSDLVYMGRRLSGLSKNSHIKFAEDMPCTRKE